MKASAILPCSNASETGCNHKPVQRARSSCFSYLLMPWKQERVVPSPSSQSSLQVKYRGDESTASFPLVPTTAPLFSNLPLRNSSYNKCLGTKYFHRKKNYNFYQKCNLQAYLNSLEAIEKSLIHAMILCKSSLLGNNYMLCIFCS